MSLPSIIAKEIMIAINATVCAGCDSSNIAEKNKETIPVIVNTRAHIRLSVSENTNIRYFIIKEGVLLLSMNCV